MLTPDSPENYNAFKDSQRRQNEKRQQFRVVAWLKDNDSSPVGDEQLANDVAKQTGSAPAPEDIVRANRELFREASDRAWAEKIGKEAPILLASLADPKHGGITRAEADALAGIEQTVSSVDRSPGAVDGERAKLGGQLASVPISLLRAYERVVLPPIPMPDPRDTLAHPESGKSQPIPTPQVGHGDVGEVAASAPTTPLGEEKPEADSTVTGRQSSGSAEPMVRAEESDNDVGTSGVGSAQPTPTKPSPSEATEEGSASTVPADRETTSANPIGAPGTPPTIQTGPVAGEEAEETGKDAGIAAPEAQGGGASVAAGATPTSIKAERSTSAAEQNVTSSALSILSPDEAFIDSVVNGNKDSFDRLSKEIDLRPDLPGDVFRLVLHGVAFGHLPRERARELLLEAVGEGRPAPDAFRREPDLVPQLDPYNGPVWEAPKPTVPFFATRVSGWPIVPTTKPPLDGSLADDQQDMSWWERVSRSFRMSNANLVTNNTEFMRDVDEALTRSAFGQRLYDTQFAFDRLFLTNDDGSPNFLGRFANWARAVNGRPDRMVGAAYVPLEQRTDKIAHRDLGPFHRIGVETLKEMEVSGFTPMSYKDIDGVGSALSFAAESLASALPQSLVSVSTGIFSAPMEVITQGGDVNAELKEKTELSLVDRVLLATAAGSLMTIVDGFELSRVPGVSNLKKKLSDVAKEKLGDSLVSRAARVAGEAVQQGVSASLSSVAQEGVKVGATVLNGGEYKDGELLERFLQAGITGFVSGALVQTGEDAVQSAVTRTVQRIADVAVAARGPVVDQMVLSRLSGVVDASKSKMQSSEGLRTAVEAAFRGGRFEKVRLSSRALGDYLDSHGIEPSSFFARMEGVTLKDFDTALAVDADLPIPVATYVTQFAGTDADIALRSHMRFDPRGLTAAEAKVLVESALKTIGELTKNDKSSFADTPSVSAPAREAPESPVSSKPTSAIDELAHVGENARGDTSSMKSVSSDGGVSAPKKRSKAEQNAITAAEIARRRARGPYGPRRYRERF